MKDNALEFISAIYSKNLGKYGATHRLSTIFQPHTNSILERFNRIIANTIRCALHHSRFSSKYWYRVYKDANFKYNLIPHSQLKRSVRLITDPTFRMAHNTFPIGVPGTFPIMLVKRAKLNSCFTHFRIFSRTSHNHIYVATQGNKIFRTWAADFKPLYPALNTATTLSTAFSDQKTGFRKKPQHPNPNEHYTLYRPQSNGTPLHYSTLNKDIYILLLISGVLLTTQRSGNYMRSKQLNLLHQTKSLPAAITF